MRPTFAASNPVQSIVRSFVSGRKMRPTSAVALAMTIEYQNPAKISPKAEAACAELRRAKKI